MLWREISDFRMRIDAAINCAVSFLDTAIGAISSFAPTRNNTMNAQRIYCKLLNWAKGVQSTIEKILPEKMPIPPKEGVRIVCERRSPGSSQRFLASATRMIEGIAK